MTKTEQAKSIVEFEFREAHNMDDYALESVEAIEVWHCYILGNEKWMFAVSEDGLMCDCYFEVTYSKQNGSFYVDHYVQYSKRIYDYPECEGCNYDNLYLSQQKKDILNKRVMELDFPVRALNILNLKDIRTVEDLIRYPLNDLKKLHNMGKKTIFEMQNALEPLGLCLGMTQAEILDFLTI